MSLTTYVYPLDLTGKSANNLVLAEPHALGIAGNRAFVMNHGPFYSKSLVVRDAVTNQILQRDTQYKALQMLPDLTALTGEMVCAIVYVTDLSVTSVTIDAQVVGGDASGYNAGIMQLIESLQLDNRAIYWGQIVGKPEFYPPTQHMHDIGDVYGFEYLVAAVYALRDSILIGDAAAHREIMDYIDGVRGELQTNMGALTGLLNTHINRTDNPHNTTKEHVGLGLLSNYGIATEAQARQATLNTVYMTPLRVAQLVDTVIGSSLSDHINRTDNPHNTTKEQVGLGLVQNYGIATTLEAQGGVVSNKYMTPALVAQAISALAGNALNAHIQRSDNPHGTTKAHVGLGNVQDLGLATTGEAEAGTSNAKYMTPALVKAAIALQALNPLNAHIGRTDNPHGTTKAHVGLGSVQDFPLASNAEAQAATATNRYMTPALVRLAIDAMTAGNMNTFNQHIARTDNPHGTNKSHVGLGSVQNFDLATEAEARGGASNSKYMTPQRTAQAISSLAIDVLSPQINNRVVINSDASLGSLAIGGGYLYSSGGGFNIRAGGGAYYSFAADGTFTVHNGRVIAAAGFRPSDKRLKRKIEKTEARPLWRVLDFKTWELRSNGDRQRGWVAQDVEAAAKDLVFEYTHNPKTGLKRLSVDMVGVATEMAHAAGLEIDALRVDLLAAQQHIASLTRQVESLLAAR